MKNNPLLVVIVVILIVLGIAAYAVRGQEATRQASVAEKETFEDVAERSGEIPSDGEYAISAGQAVNWEGYKTLIVNYVDRGTIGIKDGSFQVENGVVKAGTLNFDIASLHVVSTGKNAFEDGLEKHLKSKDFFDAEAFPTAKFVVKSSIKNDMTNRQMVVGDLTLKDKTNEVEFPVDLTQDDGSLRISAQLKLDRTKWGMQYGSGSFLKDLGDKVIGDEIQVTFQITADKM